MKGYRIPRVVAAEVVVRYEQGKRNRRGRLVGKEEVDERIELSIQRLPQSKGGPISAGVKVYINALSAGQPVTHKKTKNETSQTPSPAVPLSNTKTPPKMRSSAQYPAMSAKPSGYCS